MKPHSITQEAVERMIALRKLGLSLFAVAKAVGCDPTTVLYHTSSIFRELKKRKAKERRMGE